MTIIIEKNFTKDEIKATLEQLTKSKKKKGLRKHFGISQLNIDAVAFQKKVRDEWN